MFIEVPGIAQSVRKISIHLNDGEIDYCRPVVLRAREISEEISHIAIPKQALLIEVESSEQTKSVVFRDKLLGQYATAFRDMDALIIIGGGSVLNLGTALAAHLSKNNQNGSRFHLVLVPTTLLGMADAAYGSAGLLNDGSIKNAVNIKFDPDSIILNPVYLTTLPVAEKKRGLVECLKHAILQEQPSSDKTPTVSQCLSLLKASDPDNEVLFSCVLKTIEARAQIAEAVNAGNKLAAYLPSYGHVDVEPREVASDFHLSHGDAVLLGLMIETSLAGLHTVVDAISNIVPYTPLIRHVAEINFSHEIMKATYRLGMRPRFRTNAMDQYQMIALDRVGQFATLERDTFIPLKSYDFDAFFETGRQLLSLLQQ